MQIVDSILMELDQESRTTQKLLERIPEDKLSWKPHAKSQSLGVLSMHIAGVPGLISSAAAQDTFEFSPNPTPEPKSRKEVLDTFSQGLAKAKETLKTMDDARMMATWKATMKGVPIMIVPRIGFIRSILLNHLYHHRGQLSVYLRLLDVPVPSIYGPSADENPFG
jgi:uncharacterized damage-inducible protein DinB